MLTIVVSAQMPTVLGVIGSLRNTQVRTDLLEAAVWGEVQTLLKNPQRLEEEYRRRGSEPTSAMLENLASLSAQITKLRRGIGRLIDSYAEGLIEKGEFEPRITRLKERVASLEAQVKHLNDEAMLHRELRLIIGRLEEFAQKVSNGLEQASWDAQREIIRTLVKRVEVDEEQVNVVFRVEPGSGVPHPEPEILPDCGRRNHPTLRGAFLGV